MNTQNSNASAKNSAHVPSGNESLSIRIDEILSNVLKKINLGQSLSSQEIKQAEDDIRQEIGKILHGCLTVLDSYADTIARDASQKDSKTSS